MRRTKEIIANCIIGIEDEGDLVAIRFGFNRSHSMTREPHEVAAIMMTARAREDLMRRLAQGPRRSVN